MKLYEKIIKLRKEKGLSQEELGNAINVSRQAISKWESEQTKPDIDKLKEMATFFGVSCDYLLDDEIDEYKKAEMDVQEKKQETIETKPKSKIKCILKCIGILLLIYSIIVLYKIIVLSRFYTIANSFSEENYSMHQSSDTSTPSHPSFHSSTSTEKYGNKIISYSEWHEGSMPNMTEDNAVIFNQIDYVDADKKIEYRLNYDFDTQKYTYFDGDSRFLEKNQKNYTEEELERLLDFDTNLIKEVTLANIPSSAKEICLSAINPLCLVSLENRAITTYSITNNAKIRVTLNNDYVIESCKAKMEFDGYISNYYSYDYVQDHFDKEITPPLEAYKDKIVNIEEVK